MLGLSLSSVSKHTMWSCYVGCRCCIPSVNTICSGIMIGLSSSVNTISGRIIMIGLSLSSVSNHNMWSYYDWVVVVVVRQ